jgi:adenine phosphoribosyltransferase
MAGLRQILPANTSSGIGENRRQSSAGRELPSLHKKDAVAIKFTPGLPQKRIDLATTRALCHNPPSMTSDALQRLRHAIRDIPDFPKPGIVFKDITPILSSGPLFKETVDLFVAATRPHDVSKIVGIDARGFLFGAAVAYSLGIGFVPIRKQGKLPFRCESAAYQLEYGEAVVEIHVDALEKGERVVLIDDLLATGGTAAAAVKLIEKMGAKVAEAQFLIELAFLGGRRNLAGTSIRALIEF